MKLEDRVRSSSPLSRGGWTGGRRSGSFHRGFLGLSWQDCSNAGVTTSAGGALRYRRGEGGRQPLTPENIETGSFRDGSEPGSTFGWEITLRPPKSRVGVPERGEPRIWRGG